ncbi:hypothetical protein HSX11_19960 [Oxalobacteraceae bacterium]|nr:hypothetical protein [Oxalobacteraceae bacterium]
MKFDDASWHYGNDFPNDLPPEAGATHIGMFVAWCLLNGLAGELHAIEFEDGLRALQSKQYTPGAWFSEYCDSKFTEEDINEEGYAFTASYYEGERPQYISDYEEILGNGLASLYHVPDTWDSYSALAPGIAKRFSEWKQKAS